MNSMTDPGPGSKFPTTSIDQLRFGEHDHSGLQRVISENSQLNRIHSGGEFNRQVSVEGGKRTLFLHDARQLAATSPCSPEELSVVSVLNKVMLEESRGAELVCTNLPDMPPSDSSLGYCQLVEAMTAEMKRVILVRGTSSEVITAFT